MAVNGGEADTEVLGVGFTEFGDIGGDLAVVYVAVFLVDFVDDLLDLRSVGGCGACG
jgi:hypothetical protein